jgi:hypothetical protein
MSRSNEEKASHFQLSFDFREQGVGSIKVKYDSWKEVPGA